jgi:glycosyltransferase involved in cell wall biosynthesis
MTKIYGNKSLGIYYGAISIVDGRIFTYGPFAKYLKHVSGMFGKIVLMAPAIRGGRFDLTNEVCCSNIEVVPVEPFSTTIEAFKKRKRIKSALRKVSGSFDVLWMRYPTQYGEILAREAQKAGKKVIIQIVGDPVDAVANTEKYSGIARLGAWAYAKHKERSMFKVCEGTRVYTNGRVLYDKFSLGGSRKNVKKVVSSSLCSDDYYTRKDTCENDEVVLLYVGYLQRRKGVDYLIRAFAEVCAGGVNARLVIVGEGEEKPSLQNLVSELALNDRISFKGHVPMGERLQGLFRKSDMYVFPTIAGEGTPRTVLEAMANSLPVIATNVCGIPDVIDDGRSGLLIEPRSVDDIVVAVNKVINDRALRTTLVAAGHETARKHSMANFLNSMFDDAMTS